jgi:hypothetical protein
VNDSKYSIIHTIICDDVRREDNGKEILIGVYNDTIVLETTPTMLPVFAVRFLARFASAGEYKLNGSILTRSDREAVRFEINLKVDGIKYLSSFFIKVSPFPISEFGTYRIIMGMGSAQQVVYSFEVITKEQMQNA